MISSDRLKFYLFIAVYLRTISQLLNVKMTDEWQILKDVEGRGRHII
jgi:hypothetical protein